LYTSDNPEVYQFRFNLTDDVFVKIPHCQIKYRLVQRPIADVKHTPADHLPEEDRWEEDRWVEFDVFYQALDVVDHELNMTGDGFLW
jgi:hypothetical protein